MANGRVSFRNLVGARPGGFPQRQHLSSSKGQTHREVGAQSYGPSISPVFPGSKVAWLPKGWRGDNPVHPRTGVGEVIFPDAVLLHCGTGSHRPRQGCPATSSSPTTPKPSTVCCPKRKPRRREGCVQKKFLGRFDVTSPHTQGSAAKPASPWAIHCRPIRGSKPCQRLAHALDCVDRG